MKKEKLLKLWNKKASGSFKNDILKDVKNEILKNNTLLSYDIDNFVYSTNDLSTLYKLNIKLNKVHNKIHKLIEKNKNNKGA